MNATAVGLINEQEVKNFEFLAPFKDCQREKGSRVTLKNVLIAKENPVITFIFCAFHFAASHVHILGVNTLIISDDSLRKSLLLPIMTILR